LSKDETLIKQKHIWSESVPKLTHSNIEFEKADDFGVSLSIQIQYFLLTERTKNKNHSTVGIHFLVIKLHLFCILAFTSSGKDWEK